MPRWLKIGLIVFVILAITVPTLAASLWHSGAHLLHQATHNLSTFAHQAKNR